MATGVSGRSPFVSRLFYITDRLTNTRYLVDTGAEVSVIPPSCSERCHPQDGLALRAANDSTIATFGTRSITLDLGLSRIFTWIFIIAAVKRPILGADFLKHYGLAEDVKCQKLLDSMTQCKVQGASAPEPSLNLTLLPAKSDNVFEALLQEFPSVIQSLNEQTPIKHNVTHHIITSGPPVHARARRLPPEQLAIARMEFDHMLQLGIVRPSSSMWATPLHMVSKKTPGDWRP